MKYTNFLKIAALKGNITLRPHQEEAVSKYLKNKNQLLMYHGLGSGKTLASLAAIERSGSKRPMIVVPAPLQKNYSDSLNNFVTPDSVGKYVIISQEKYRRNPHKYLDKYKPDSVVVDEQHRSRNKDTKLFKALKETRKKVPNFLGLSATPQNNSPADMFNMLNTVSDGKVPTFTGKEFDKKYTTKEKVYPKNIFKKIVAKVTGRHGEKKTLKNPDELKKIISPYVHKNEPTPDFLKEFPSKTEKNIDVPMTKEQSKKYKYFMDKNLSAFDRFLIKNDLPPKMKDQTGFFARLINARQIANTPAVASKQDMDPIQSSGKLTKALANLDAHLKDNKQHKAVIYSNFRESSLKPIEAALKKRGIEYAIFAGGIKKKLKDAHIEDYNSGKKRVLLISPSGAEGLDLKKTTLLQNLDQSYNPSFNHQIIGRTVRYKSHEGLPKKLRNVKVENYRSVIRKPLLKRIFSKKKYEPSIDHYIQHRAGEKADLNKQLGDML